MNEIKKQFLAKGYSPSSAHNYTRWLLQLRDYSGKSDLTQITMDDVENYIYNYLTKRKNLKSQSINNAISASIVYFNSILNLEYDFTRIKRPVRKSTSVEFLTPHETLTLIKSADSAKSKLVLSLLYSCALDINALLKIRLDDVSLSTKTIKVRNTKNRIFRETLISDFEAQLIEEYLEVYKPLKFLFEAKTKQTFSARAVHSIVQNAVIKSKIPKVLSSRSLKYSYVKHLTDLGYPLNNVLSHIKLKYAATYNSLLFDSQKKVDCKPLSKIISYEFEDRLTEINAKNELLSDQLYLYQTPYLTSEDVDSAIMMSKLYVIVHCYENSTRSFIYAVLQDKYGDNWWEKIAAPELKNRVTQKMQKEKNMKWMSTRNENYNPLYYCDWSDLLKIIRKQEECFIPFLHDLKFVELRLGELERTRHIIAHNGILPSEDDYNRLLLYYKDWIKQLK